MNEFSGLNSDVPEGGISAQAIKEEIKRVWREFDSVTMEGMRIRELLIGVSVGSPFLRNGLDRWGVSRKDIKELIDELRKEDKLLLAMERNFAK